MYIGWSVVGAGVKSPTDRATKYILNDFKSNYRSRLVSLQLLPLSMTLELNDIISFSNL